MNTLSIQKRTDVISALVEGNSIRAACRLTGVAKGTVLSLLVRVGRACADYHDAAVRNVNAKRIQADEIWSFCGAKKKNVTPEMISRRGYAGDVWTWTALDPDSKLIVSWFVGDRGANAALAFMRDLSSRLTRRIQLTTDGHGEYVNAVEWAFGIDIDFAQLIKIFRNDPGPNTRYSPPRFIRLENKIVLGNPDRDHISTSFVERQNLTMRMSMRRFTRLTNGFSKKVENLEAAVALHFVYYNFVRVHQTLRVSPAMAAGIATRLWEISDIVKLAEPAKSETLNQKKSN
jgi:IS1 family transposase